jgi:hypothetical protein
MRPVVRWLVVAPWPKSTGTSARARTAWSTSGVDACRVGLLQAAPTLNNIGVIHQMRANHPAALVAFERALAILQANAQSCAGAGAGAGLCKSVFVRVCVNV